MRRRAFELAADWTECPECDGTGIAPDGLFCPFCNDGMVEAVEVATDDDDDDDDEEQETDQ